MAKRKCVKEAIIEISDSEDGGSDVEEIVTPLPKLKTRKINTENKEEILEVINNEGECASARKDSKKRVGSQSSGRGLKRKRSTSGSVEGMGLLNSKSKVKKRKNARADGENLPPISKASSNPSSSSKSAGKNSKTKMDDAAENYMARLRDSDVCYEEWTDVDYIREVHGVSKFVAQNLVKLLQEENTIPFIARYRKYMTMDMEVEELRRVKNSYEKAKLIKQKARTIIREIDKQGKWTPEFHAFVQGTKSLNDLEHIHSMFKVTKSSILEKAREAGLDVPAENILKSRKIEPLYKLVDPKVKGLQTEKEVKEGIVYILADVINKDEGAFEEIKKLRKEYPLVIETAVKATEKSKKEEPKTDKRKDEETKYDLYHNFSSSETNLKPHQVLAINRGEARKILSVKVNVPAEFEHAFKRYCQNRYQMPLNASPLHSSLVKSAIDHVWTKSIKAQIVRRTRQELNETAEIASMDVFAENVKQLLLMPPVRGKVVLGIDPGFQHGCKLAVVSKQGDVLKTKTIYPHDTYNKYERRNAENTLVHIVTKYNCTILALGNGKACRETEVFISELIKKQAFGSLNVVYAIVDETGASIYSCSDEASNEFPNLNVNVISAISIARRLQDPMAELVKIEPKHLGVGMYQHDLPEKQLMVKLNEVIMEAVSFVGVDINTASVSLLKRIAGLGDARAKHIIEWRRSNGPFQSRGDLLKVPGIGSKTFEQCAGFIRVMPETATRGDKKFKIDRLNHLDQTWIHPESYDVASALIQDAMCDTRQVGTKSFIRSIATFANQGYKALAKKFNTAVETIKIIVEGLSMEKGQDIRADADESTFRKNLTTFDDLKVGTVLTGVVRNNTHFGAFVDVGVERSGLIHKSQMGGVTLSVGQKVETKVHNVEKERGRLGLTLIKCL